MKKIFLFWFFGVIALGVRAQVPYDTVTVVDPQNFTLAVTIDTALVQVISRKANANRRINFQTIKNYSTPDITLSWLGIDIEDTTGTSATYRDFFVTDNEGEVWFVDNAGSARKLYDPAQFQAVTISNDTLYISDGNFAIIPGIASAQIDSVSYYGDTLRIYEGGDTIPFKAEIIGGDGNGIISTLPIQSVTIDPNNFDLQIGTDALNNTGEFEFYALNAEGNDVGIYAGSEDSSGISGLFPAQAALFTDDGNVLIDYNYVGDIFNVAMFGDSMFIGAYPGADLTYIVDDLPRDPQDTITSILVQDWSTRRVYRRDAATLDGVTPTAVVPVTAAGRDTIDFNSEYWGIFHLDLSGPSQDTLVFVQPQNGGQYVIDLDNVTTDTVVWPVNLLDANEDTLGSRIYTAGKMLSLYWDGTNYYTPQALGSPYIDSSVTYHPYYQEILDTASANGYALPSLAQKALQNELIEDLIANNIWDSLEVFHVYATDADANFSLLDWKNPGGGHDGVLIGGDLTWTSDQGWVRSVSDTSVINTNWDITNDATIAAYNHFGIGTYNYAFVAGTLSNYAGSFDGLSSARVQVGASDSGADNLQGRAFSTNLVSMAATQPETGFVHIYRAGSTVKMYRNAVVGTTTTTEASTTINTIDTYVMGMNTEAGRQTGANFTATISVFWMGRELSSKVVEFNSIINTYIAGL